MMKKTIAVPIAVLLRGDPDEISQYGDKVMTVDECRAREAEVAAVEAEQAATAYIDERIPEYPSIGDQLDALMVWVATGDQEPLKLLAAQCMDVKKRYPKVKIE